MNVVEAVSIHQDLDPWLSLEALSKVSGCSVRTLRGYLSDPEHPLPHFRLKEAHVITEQKPRKEGAPPRRRTVSGKITVRWSEFQRWYEAFRHRPDHDGERLARLVDAVASEFRR